MSKILELKNRIDKLEFQFDKITKNYRYLLSSKKIDDKALNKVEKIYHNKLNSLQKLYSLEDKKKKEIDCYLN